MVFDTVNTEHRKIIDFRKFQIEGVVLIGRYNYSSVSVAPKEETFPQHLEIVFTDKGYHQYQIAGESFYLRADEAIFIFPGEPHSPIGEYEQRGRLYWMIINTHNIRSFLGLDDARSSRLFEALLSRDYPRKFATAPQLKQILERTFEISDKYDGNTVNNHLDILRMEACLIDCLLAFLDCRQSGRSSRTYTHELTRPIALAIRTINENIYEKISIKKLASNAGLSIDYFKKRFKQEVGVPPNDYTNMRKIEIARKLLLETDKPITTIAVDLEFSSSQYFCNVFRKYSGYTPSSYRKSHANRSRS